MGTMPRPTNNPMIELFDRVFALHGPYSVGSLPRTSGIYFVVEVTPTRSASFPSTFPGELRYIGQSHDVSERVTSAHQRYHSWGSSPHSTLHIYVLRWLDDEDSRLRVEKELINSLRPKLNVDTSRSSGPIGRYLSTREREQSAYSQ